MSSAKRPGAPESGHADGTTECTSCPLVSTRREFLASAIIAAAAAMATLGVARSAFAEGVVSRAHTLRAVGALHSYAIPEADGVHIDHDNDVILVRWEHQVYAFNLSCPHQNSALRWNESDHRFQCPKHKSKYRPDGQFIEGRATRGMDRLAVRRDGSSIVVDLDRMIKQDVDPAGWSAAVVSVTP